MAYIQCIFFKDYNYICIMKLFKYNYNLFNKKECSTKTTVSLTQATKWDGAKKQIKFEKQIESLSIEGKRIMRKMSKINHSTIKKLAR